MSKIVLTNVDKYYGKNHVLKNLNLTIEDGDFMTLLGPSGCGKTITLRVVSGLEKPQNGFIHMDGKEIANAAEAVFAPLSKRNLNLEQFPKILRKVQRPGNRKAALSSLAGVSPPASSALPCNPRPRFLFSHYFWELL